MKDTRDSIVRIIASNRTWLESQAIDQLKQTALLPGMVAAVGMPDLHPGNQHPVGAVFATQGRIYPALAGSDIGCGMSLYQTSMKASPLKLDKLVKKFNGFEDMQPNDVSRALEVYRLQEHEDNSQLGTIGGGNHFAELQSVETIYSQELFEGLSLSPKACYLLIHSGSRQLGHQIYKATMSVCGEHGFDLTLEHERQSAIHYMEKHDYAVNWARANRDVIAEKIFDLIHCTGTKCVDVCHNSIAQEQWGDNNVWAHRKGASSSMIGPVVIPGSRGHHTYLVQPTGNQDDNGYSLAHGAGRKWQRSIAKANLSKRYKTDELKRTALGSRVICEDKDLIYEEAPQAYKNIEAVIQDLVDSNVIKLIARFKPLITYKTSRGSHVPAKD